MLRFVLLTSCKTAVDWVARIPNFTLGVNLAPKNVADPELFDVIDSALDETGFPADHLVLEVNEDILAHNEDLIHAQFSKLRSRGIRIAIDDFGTGHTSLVSLKDLPVDQLKIDKSFVVPCPSNETDRRIVAALVQLAHAVDLEVIAEGIEDADILQTLLSIGCETGEGFHFSHPIPAVEFEEEWIARFDRARAEFA